MRPCSRIRLSTKIFFNLTLFCLLLQQLIIFVLRKAMGPTELGSLSLRSRQPCPSEQPSAVHTSNDWFKEIVGATNTWNTIFKIKPKATIQKLPAVISTDGNENVFFFFRLGLVVTLLGVWNLVEGRAPRKGRPRQQVQLTGTFFFNPFCLKRWWCWGAGCVTSGGTTTGCAADV